VQILERERGLWCSGTDSAVFERPKEGYLVTDGVVVWTLVKAVNKDVACNEQTRCREINRLCDSTTTMDDGTGGS
jgi:hypothetical protein